LGLLVAATYLPSLANDFVYDDHEVIVVQPRPESPLDLARSFAEPHFRGLPYYRPVVRASLLGQKALHGDAPALFHLGNALLAGVAAIAAYALLRARALGVARWAAFLAAAIFALHPVASSAVLPIASGRETLLPACWILAATAAWLRDRRGIALACLAGALGSKEQAAVTPLLLALADALRLAPGAPALALRALPHWIVRYAGVVAVALAYVAIRRVVLGSTAVEWAIAADPIAPLRSLLFGLQVALAPFAALRYEPELGVWLSAGRVAFALAALAGLALLARASGAPPIRVAAFWLGWFVVTQLPTANVFRQEAPFDERYAFLALLAFPAVAAASATALATTPRRRLVAIGAGALLVATCAALSLGRVATFRNDTAFATQWLATNPRAAEAHHLLAVVAMQDGRLGEAIASYRAALDAGAVDSPDLHVNLAVALAESGRTTDAMAELARALALDPGHPEAHATRGTLLARSGRLEEAAAAHREAIRAAPHLASAHANLGSVLARLGRFDEAEVELREALRLAPDDPDARRNLVQLLRATGRNAKAETIPP